jgi:hypothetical protein
VPMNPAILSAFAADLEPCCPQRFVYPGTLISQSRPDIGPNKLYPRYKNTEKYNVQNVAAPFGRVSCPDAGGAQ